jgi:hypothetical protein
MGQAGISPACFLIRHRCGFIHFLLASSRIGAIILSKGANSCPSMFILIPTIRRPDGKGVSSYFRNVTEIVLFGVHGFARTPAPGRQQANLFKTGKREHSRKPDELQDFLGSCSPGAPLELLPGHYRPAWYQWGDEVTKSDTWNAYLYGRVKVTLVMPAYLYCPIRLFS